MCITINGVLPQAQQHHYTRLATYLCSAEHIPRVFQHSCWCSMEPRRQPARVLPTLHKQWKRATRMLLTLPPITSTPAVMMPSHLAAAHKVLACSPAECCKEQSTSASALPMDGALKSEHSNGRRRRTQMFIPNRFSQCTAQTHAADAQRGGEDHVGRMRAAAGPDKKVHK